MLAIVARMNHVCAYLDKSYDAKNSDVTSQKRRGVI